ncbi:RICIN domain-containing protein [Streptomyces benahoarensis]|uniref:Ricin-type beta-trefoil lectin domain protein n=1 Tax=Streptomyces benahoarensis TaxID=2595054 RepID=A0A553ZQU4_9ACTN|nr:RICIN domain-containing protein [Streptomyces benahoarensis]TSB32825.1 ricin-type beta-trefoil lectin domain protein [Streptomyces benahoarensis]TSB43848.1 ricin-type beta-trefoil lectin domain protein [Streptomyces benahoarensis]
MSQPRRPADRDRPANWFTRIFGKRRADPFTGGLRTDHGMWTVDRAMRVMATACARENREVPEAQAVLVGADTVRFLLRSPDERPPAGWTADPDARAWTAQLRGIQTAEVEESVREPYPQLVSLGSSSAGFALLNLGDSGGIIALEGDSRRARALVQEWTRELTTNPWSRGVQVVRVGFKPGTADPIGTTEVQSLEDAAAAMSQPAGGVLILASMPGGRDKERVRYLADHPRTPWAVVVLGRGDRPRWRFTLDSRGLIDTRLLPEPVLRPLNPALDTPPLADDVKDVTVTPAPRAAAAPPARPVAGEAAGKKSSSRRSAVLTGSAVVAVCAVTAGLIFFLGDRKSSDSASPASASPAPSSSTAATATAGTGGTGGSPSPTSGDGPAEPNPLGTSLINDATGNCLTGGAGSDGTPLALAPCDGQPNQLWKISEDGTIQTKGLCMDAAWGATEAGTSVQIANCSGNPAQQFSLRNDTLYTSHADKCVREIDHGKSVQLQPCGNGPLELFRRK